jgi:hypothetical protein
MLTTRVITSLATVAVAVAFAPASSSARPIQERAQQPRLDRCYQLNPVVPGQPRGSHRVPCGVDVPSFARR